MPEPVSVTTGTVERYDPGNRRRAVPYIQFGFPVDAEEVYLVLNSVYIPHLETNPHTHYKPTLSDFPDTPTNIVYQRKIQISNNGYIELMPESLVYPSCSGATNYTLFTSVLYFRNQNGTTHVSEISGSMFKAIQEWIM